MGLPGLMYVFRCGEGSFQAWKAPGERILRRSGQEAAEDFEALYLGCIDSLT
jgi:hypothetical protein